MANSSLDRPLHGHHKIAAAIFVASLIIGAALILAAELMKTERYVFYPNATSATNYVLFDRETGRAAVVDYNAKNPTESFTK